MAKKNSLVMGAYNYSHIDWVNTCLSHRQVVKFLGMLNDCTMEQMVMEPTLDLIISGNQHLVRSVVIGAPVGIIILQDSTFLYEEEGFLEGPFNF